MSDKIPESNWDWKQYLFSWKGRIPRAHWWNFQIVSVLLEISVWVLMAGMAEGPVPYVGIIIFVLYHIVMIYIGIGMNVKRLHDIGRSGWEVLWGLIPCIGGIYILAVCGFVRGEIYKNQYGPNPNEQHPEN